MPLLPRKAVLAVAAVIDVAMQEHGKPISAKTLAARHSLPPRHLEPVLQALVRCGILKGIRGPRGGYELAHSRRAGRESLSRFRSEPRPATPVPDAEEASCAASQAVFQKSVSHAPESRHQ